MGRVISTRSARPAQCSLAAPSIRISTPARVKVAEQQVAERMLLTALLLVDVNGHFVSIDVRVTARSGVIPPAASATCPPAITASAPPNIERRHSAAIGGPLPRRRGDGGGEGRR